MISAARPTMPTTMLRSEVAFMIFMKSCIFFAPTFIAATLDKRVIALIANIIGASSGSKLFHPSFHYNRWYVCFLHECWS